MSAYYKRKELSVSICSYIPTHIYKLCSFSLSLCLFVSIYQSNGLLSRNCKAEVFVGFGEWVHTIQHVSMGTSIERTVVCHKFMH